MYEQFKYYTVTLYVEESTGNCVAPEEIGVNYQKTHLIDTKCDTNNENYTKKITRIMGCERIPFIQLKLSL